MGTSIRDHPTKARLLDAAAGVFARHGFRDAGVREICAAAGVNQASVNYHFGSKEGLYSAVLQDAYDRAGPGWPMPRLADSPDNPEHALREWIRWFMERMFSEHHASRLLLHELRDPTPMLGQLVDRSMRPVFEAVREIVCAITGQGPEDPFVVRSLASLFGQCTIYRTSRPLLEHMMPERHLDDPKGAAIAAHIYAFTMAALKAEADR